MFLSELMNGQRKRVFYSVVFCFLEFYIWVLREIGLYDGSQFIVYIIYCICNYRFSKVLI